MPCVQVSILQEWIKSYYVDIAEIYVSPGLSLSLALCLTTSDRSSARGVPHSHTGDAERGAQEVLRGLVRPVLWHSVRAVLTPPVASLHCSCEDIANESKTSQPSDGGLNILASELKATMFMLEEVRGSVCLCSV